MDPREETLGILNKIWVKLHGLPNANAVDQGAFFIILTFICEFSAITHYLVSFKEWAAHDAAFICTPLSDGPTHDCAVLRELLLLLRSQDSNEGVDNLKKNSERIKNIFTSHIDSNNDQDISAGYEVSCRVCSAALEEPNPHTKTHLTITEGWPDWLPNTHTTLFKRIVIPYSIPARMEQQKHPRPEEEALPTKVSINMWENKIWTYVE